MTQPTLPVCNELPCKSDVMVRKERQRCSVVRTVASLPPPVRLAALRATLTVTSIYLFRKGLLSHSSLAMPQDSNDTTTQPAEVTPQKKKHHKSVRSLTRDYEEQQPSSSIHSTLTPTPSSHTHSHVRAPSVLLASPQYPSTLLSADVSPTRPRTISGSSGSLSPEALRSASISIASASYPSTYSTSPTNRAKSSSSSGPSRSTSPAPAALATDMSRTLPTLSVTTTLTSPVLDEEAKDGLSELATHTHTNGSSSSTSNGIDKASMTPAERREHSRAHSKVHAKNLSVFFPRPGSEAEAEADSARASETFSAGLSPGSVGAPSPGAGEAGLAPPSSAGSGLSPSRSRRGHHRKHSVNHAMYDGQTMSVSPGATSADLQPPPASPYSSAAPSPLLEQRQMQPSTSDSSSVSNASAQHAHAHSHSHSHAHASPTPGVLARLASMPRSTRPLLLYGVVHFALGAALWVAGQAGDSLAMGGLGYLVVFDALGELCAIGGDWARAGAGSKLGMERVYR